MKLLSCCSKSDSVYALIWAKKIKAVNMLGGKCAICGNDNVFVLDFHHDKGDKEYTFSRIKDARWSKIEKEIEKCILLCKNCHQQLHYPETNIYKKKLMEAKGSDRCSRCGYKECLTSLDFHHIDGADKSFAIADKCRKHGFMGTMDNMINEIQKCDILCRNCHAIEQIKVDRFNRLRELICTKIDSYQERPLEVDNKMIVELFQKGMSGRDIAKVMKCARSTVSLLLRKNNIVARKKLETFTMSCPVCKGSFEVKGEYYRKTRRFCSRGCMAIGQRRSKWPTKEQLEIFMTQLSWSELGQKYGVTDNAVRNWVKHYGLKKM